MDTWAFATGDPSSLWTTFPSIEKVAADAVIINEKARLNLKRILVIERSSLTLFSLLSPTQTGAWVRGNPLYYENPIDPHHLLPTFLVNRPGLEEIL